MGAVQAVFADKYDVDCRIIKAVGGFTPLAFEAVKGGATHIICVGGDGSLNETVNGLMQAKNDESLRHINWQNIRLGLLPAGTGNDFAKTAEVTHNLIALKQLIEQDSYKSFDLGLVELMSANGGKISRYFMNITDVGIGGVIARKIAGSSKRFGATITYQSAIISSLLAHKNHLINITADSFKHEGPVMSFIMANGKYFGAGLGIAPDAMPDDGQLSTVVVGDISVMDYLRNLGKIRKCIKIDHPELKYSNAKNIEVDSPEGPLPVDMDGEFAGYTPLKASIAAGALNFICPG